MSALSSRGQSSLPKGERKVKFKLISVLAAGLLFSVPAFSATVTYDFEGVDSFTSVGNHYDAVTFGGGATALGNDVLGTYFTNPPSGTTVMTAFDGDSTMTTAYEMKDAVSFRYAAAADTTVNIWSGANGTGSILGTFNLAANQDSCGNALPLCHWDLASVSFSGAAHSVTFGDAANAAMFDDVTVNAVPLPAGVWLLVSALGGMGVIRRKRAA
jgi:hypothetical protein